MGRVAIQTPNVFAPTGRLAQNWAAQRWTGAVIMESASSAVGTEAAMARPTSVRTSNSPNIGRPRAGSAIVAPAPDPAAIKTRSREPSAASTTGDAPQPVAARGGIPNPPEGSVRESRPTAARAVLSSGQAISRSAMAFPRNARARRRRR